MRRRRIRNPLRQLRDWGRSRVAEVLPRLKRFPPVKITTGPALPGWVLRLVLVAVGLSSALLVARGALAWTIVIGLCLVLVVVPGGLVAPTLALLLGLMALLGAAGGVSSVRTALLLLGLHALVQLDAVIGRSSLANKVELRVLALPLRRFAAIQAFGQVLALLGAWLTGQRISLVLVPVVAVLAIAVLTYLWAPGLGRPRRTGTPLTEQSFIVPSA